MAGHQQHQHLLGISYKRKSSGPISDPLNLKLWGQGHTVSVLTSPPGDANTRLSLRTTGGECASSDKSGKGPENIMVQHSEEIGFLKFPLAGGNNRSLSLARADSWEDFTEGRGPQPQCRRVGNEGEERW